MQVKKSGVPRGIKRKDVKAWQRDRRNGSAEAKEKLAKLLGEVSESNRVNWRQIRGRNITNQALAWANIKRLPVEEIATQIALKHLKASVDWVWPRKVTFADFEEKVLRPLVASQPKDYHGKPINASWIMTLSPNFILRQVELNVLASKQMGDKVTTKQVLEDFWTRSVKSGFRGLTRSEGLSRMRFLAKPKRKSS